MFVQLMSALTDCVGRTLARFKSEPRCAGKYRIPDSLGKYLGLATGAMAPCQHTN
jgi:hypothetical protein